MPKPTTVPLWDINQTNITAPSSALVDDGWPDNDIPTAANFNYQLYWLGQWASWLDSGSLGDLTIEDLLVTGSATVNGDIVVLGEHTVTGDTHLDANLFVAGQTVLSDILQVTGAVDATASGISVGSNPVKHSNQTIPFGFDQYMVVSASGTISHTDGVGGIRQAANSVAYYRLPVLPSHKRLKSLVVWANNEAGGTTNIAVATYDAGATSMLDIVDDNLVTVATSLTLNLGPTTVSDKVFTLKVTTDATHYVDITVGQLVYDYV